MVRNQVVLGSGYTRVFIYSGENIYNVIDFCCRVLDNIVEDYKKVLLSLELLAVCGSVHEYEQGFGINQNHKLVSSQLSFKNMSPIDNS